MKKKIVPRRHRAPVAIFLATLFVVLPLRTRAGDKLKPEEIVAKHLQSIGTAAALSAVRTRVAGGTVVATFSSPSTGRFKGRVVMASDGNKNLLGMAFETPNYSGENIAYDGDGVSIGYARAGVRSNLGDLITTYKAIVKNGLVGGEISQAWPLYDLAQRNAKLEYRGTKKVAGKMLHEVRFMPRGGSDLQISLFFDAETFQHMRTEYTHVIAPRIGATVDMSASQTTTRYKMIETFSDFRKEGELTLPHGYNITLEFDTRIPFRGSWDISLNQFVFNENIPATMFNVGPKL